MRAFSLNRGGLRLLATQPDGWRPGQDVAGVAVKSAADDSWAQGWRSRGRLGRSGRLGARRSGPGNSHRRAAGTSKLRGGSDAADCGHEYATSAEVWWEVCRPERACHRCGRRRRPLRRGPCDGERRRRHGSSRLGGARQGAQGMAPHGSASLHPPGDLLVALHARGRHCRAGGPAC